MPKAAFIAILFLLSLSSLKAHSHQFVLRNDLPANLPDSPRVSANRLTLMWWNLGCSSSLGLNTMSEEKKKNYSPASQWQNIREIIHSDYAPDVMILGEYCPKYFDHSTYEEIRTVYPHAHRLVKINAHFKIRNGMRVFSKEPVQLLEEFELPHAFHVSNFLNDCSSSVPSDRQWTRILQKLSVTKNNTTYTIFPVHLANPWKDIKNCYGPFKLAQEITTGKENVNYVQSLKVLETFQTEESGVLIGDFNAIKSWGPLSSSSYSLLSQAIGESVLDTNSPTFIDKNIDIFKGSIDHAFLSKNLQAPYAEVLPLSGSDHLPLLIQIEAGEED